MQPEPLTPRGLSLAGLSEEEQAFLMQPRQAEVSSTPQSRKAPAKGTKRIFSAAGDAASPSTPVSAAVECNQSAARDDVGSAPSDEPENIVHVASAATSTPASYKARQNNGNKRAKIHGVAETRTTPVATLAPGGTPIAMSDDVSNEQSEGAQANSAANAPRPLHLPSIISRVTLRLQASRPFLIKQTPQPFRPTSPLALHLRLLTTCLRLSLPSAFISAYHRPPHSQARTAQSSKSPSKTFLPISPWRSCGIA
jgi:hypothetical protein